MRRFIFADGENIYKTIFADVDVTVIPFPFKGFHKGNNIHWLLYRMTHSKKLGYPFFRLWHRFVLFKNGVRKGDELLVLSNAVWSFLWDNSLLREAKKKKIPIILLIVDSICFFEGDRRTKIDEAASIADLVYTFDKNDAQHYGWHYTSSYYSDVSYITPDEDKTDVFCAIRNGGRIEKLVRIYDLLKARDIHCNFYITGCSEEEMTKYNRDSIVFNRFLPYEDMLSKAASANVILELVKHNQQGRTLREFEAVLLKKRLLTDYKGIFTFPYYNPDHVKYFDDDKFEEAFTAIPVNWFRSGEIADYSYQNDFSPIHLFDEIEKLLKKDHIQ